MTTGFALGCVFCVLAMIAIVEHHPILAFVILWMAASMIEKG